MMYKRKKGFTLIELLAVIIIIGVIALIVTPTIVGVIKKQEKKTFEESVQGILKAIEIDTADDNFDVPREYHYEEGVLTLVMRGTDGVNEVVKTNGKYDGVGSFYVDEDGDIIITNACNSTYCVNNSKDNPDLVIHPNDGTNNPQIDPSDPKIVLNGSKTFMVGIGRPFEDPGVKSTTYAGDEIPYSTIIKNGTTTVAQINTDIAGTYTITYTNESNGKKATVTRTVKVVEMKPQIAITSADANYIKSKAVVIKITAVSPNKVTAFTYSINGVSETVTGVSKTITLNQTGEYTIIVNVTDDNGFSNTVTSGTYKIDATAPVITFEEDYVELTASQVREYDLRAGMKVEDNIDGLIDNSKVSINGNLNNTIGEYIITYTARDSVGNVGTKQRTFKVVDSDKPEITITPTNNSIYEKSKTIQISATDNVRVERISYIRIKNGVSEGVSHDIANGGTVTINEDGIWQLEVSAVDNSGNITTITSGEYKVDVTKPTIVIAEEHKNQTIKKTEVSNYKPYEGVTATDNVEVSGFPTISCTAPDLIELKEYVVTCTATDQAGNVSDPAQKRVTVVEAEGPILNTDSGGTKGSWLPSPGKTETIRITDNSYLSSFTYEIIKDGASQGIQTVNVSGKKSADASVNLSSSGKYVIKLTGSDQYGNTSTYESGEYWIDVDKPTAGTANCNGSACGTGWYTGNVTITPVNGSDSLSGHKSTTVSPTSITSSTNGTTVTVTTRDNAGNSATKTYTVKVDKDKPIVGTIGGNSTSWTTSKTLTSTITDTNSKVRYYAVTTSSSTPTNWTSVGNIAVASYSLSHTVTANGTYYIWAKDEAGNVSAAKSVEVTKIDTTTPSITSSYTSTAYSVNEKTSVAVSTLYSATFGGMGGSVTCKNGSTTVTNLNTLAVGSYTLTCTATGLNGKTASVSPKVTIKSAGKTPTEIVTGPGTTTTGGGTRYTGANPNNYVTFNGENYRIIGVFNGQLKIMKDSNYGNKAWDTSNSNNWARPADLNTKLNSTYWNTISSTYQAMVDQSHSWGIGGISSNYTRTAFYNSENSTRWTGKVGLMSAADYGYASTSCTDSTNMYTSTACKNNNWIYNNSYHQWTITPYSGNSSSVWLVNAGGSVLSYSNASFADPGVRPVLYLKSSIKITGGTGTSSDPYKLSS